MGNEIPKRFLPPVADKPYPDAHHQALHEYSPELNIILVLPK